MAGTARETPGFDLDAALANAQLVDGNVQRSARAPQEGPFDKLLKRAWELEQRIQLPVPAEHEQRLTQRFRAAAKRQNMGLHVGDANPIVGDENFPDHVMIDVKPMPLRERAAKETPAPTEG